MKKLLIVSLLLVLVVGLWTPAVSRSDGHM